MPFPDFFGVLSLPFCTPSNGSGLPKWIPYDATSEPYLDLGDSGAVKHHLLKAQLDFLEQMQNRRQTSQ